MLTTRDSETLLLKLLVHTLEWILRPSLYRTVLKTGKSFPGSFLDLYLVDAQTLYYLSATFTFPDTWLFLFLNCKLLFDLHNCCVMVPGAKTFLLVFCRMFPSS